MKDIARKTREFLRATSIAAAFVCLSRMHCWGKKKSVSWLSTNIRLIIFMKEEVGGCYVESLCRIPDGTLAVLTGVMFFHIFVQKSAKTSQFQIINFSPFNFKIWYSKIGFTVKSQKKQNMKVSESYVWSCRSAADIWNLCLLMVFPWLAHASPGFRFSTELPCFSRTEEPI